MEEPSDDELSVKSDDRSSLKSDDSSGSNRVKYLYSYGGRILPRVADGKLRYVGGETRVMAANRNITFSEFMAKIGEPLSSSVVLKCQLPGEDIDALVSIKSDEDLENLLEEYDRLQTGKGSFKVRAFLFPKPAGPLMHPVAAVPLAARGCGGGHMDSKLDERGPANSCHVAGSNPCGCRFSKHSRSCDLEQRPHPRQPETVSVPGRLPRSPVKSPLRYATQIHDRATMSPRKNSAGRSVDREVGQFSRQQRISFQYNISPPAWIPFPEKGTEAPYYGGRLEGIPARKLFFV